MRVVVDAGDKEGGRRARRIEDVPPASHVRALIAGRPNVRTQSSAFLSHFPSIFYLSSMLTVIL